MAAEMGCFYQQLHQTALSAVPTGCLLHEQVLFQIKNQL
jgi:hypothetical protein